MKNLDPRILLFLLLAGSVFLGCVFVWGRIIERLISRAPILPYEPRSPVPWRGPELVLVFGVLIAAYALPPTLGAALGWRAQAANETPTEIDVEIDAETDPETDDESGHETADDVVLEDADAELTEELASEELAPEERTAEEPITDEEDVEPDVEELEDQPDAEAQPAAEAFLLTPRMAVLQVVVLLGATVVIALGLRKSTGATWRDFGLTSEHIGRDVRLGIAGMLAASVIVYLIQMVMVEMIGPSEHPVLEMLKAEPDMVNLLLSMALAMIAAPIVEEFVFRALIQGWLEAKEQEWALRFPAMVGRLPSGAIAITATALLFSVLHATHGPDPIALFPLAVVLGYIYHRTHRLLPCVVMHLCFNSIAVVSLWLAATARQLP